MGFVRSSLPHRALPPLRFYGHRSLGPGEASGAQREIGGGSPWLGRIIWGADALEVSMRSLTYTLAPGERSRKGFLSRVLWASLR